jgi:hypothetical protein
MDSSSSDFLDSVDQCEQLRWFVDDWGAVAREVTEAAGGGSDVLLCGGSDYEPVCLVGAPVEELRLEDLAVTMNPAFSKLIVIFAHLTTEIARLHRAAEETLFPTLVVFGERPHVGDDTLFEGDLQASLARALTQLQDVVLFLEQLTAVSRNLFAQLSALYGDVQRIYAPLQAVRLTTAFTVLGSALGLAAGLDEAVSTNVALPSAFAMFNRMLATVRADPARFDVADGGAGRGPARRSAGHPGKPAFVGGLLQRNHGQTRRRGTSPQHFLDQLATTGLTSLNISSRLSRPSDRRHLIAVLSLVSLKS